MLLIDHTNLKATATVKDITKLCDECVIYNFRGVCIPPTYVKTAAKLLGTEDREISTVIGFPLGFHRSLTKLNEAILAIQEGATELDVVWDIGAVLNKEYLRVVEELARIVKLGINVKVIIEECYFNTEQLKIAYQIVKDSGAWCIKTSTGYGPSNAALETVNLWKSLGDLKIKAAGGIKTGSQCKDFWAAGADIIGTSSGVNIVKDYF